MVEIIGVGLMNCSDVERDNGQEAPRFYLFGFDLYVTSQGFG
jgi:hypothetical protein